MGEQLAAHHVEDLQRTSALDHYAVAIGVGKDAVLGVRAQLDEEASAHCVVA